MPGSKQHWLHEDEELGWYIAFGPEVPIHERVICSDVFPTATEAATECKRLNGEKDE